MDDNSIIYIVDDDEAIREGIEDLVHSMDLQAESFASAEKFLETYKPGKPACLLLDVRMPGMSGMELLSKLSENRPVIPTIIITGHGDVPMAVEAFKTGVFDFIEKPFREYDLWLRIKKALVKCESIAKTHAQKADLEERLSLLSPREREVLNYLIAGDTDKQIANRLSISRRAVASHRANLLDKMYAANIIELTSMLTSFDISL